MLKDLVTSEKLHKPVLYTSSFKRLLTILCRTLLESSWYQKLFPAKEGEGMRKVKVLEYHHVSHSVFHILWVCTAETIFWFL